MQFSNTQGRTDAIKEGIINSLIEWSEESQDPELLELVDFYHKVKDEGSKPIYDLEGMLGTGNHISNIYEIMQDEIPRTTSKRKNRITGVIEDSALHKELYQKFNCCPSDRALMARISNIRKNTTSTPSVVYATEETKIKGRNYKRRFYFLIEDGQGRSGSVSTEECPKWHLRRK